MTPSKGALPGDRAQGWTTFPARRRVGKSELGSQRMQAQLARTMTDWTSWSDEALRDYEQSLYDEEAEGGNTWELRDEVLWEMNRRGFAKRSAT